MRLLATALVFLAATAHAQSSVTVRDAWLRAMPPGQPNGAAYLTLVNNGAEPRSLVAVSSPLAGSVEIHESSQVDGMWRMRALPALDIAPGATVELAPGGVHLMMFRMARSPQPGESVELVLQFDAGEPVIVAAEVRPAGAATHHH
jgi:copper(I)-binding protein